MGWGTGASEADKQRIGGMMGVDPNNMAGAMGGMGGGAPPGDPMNLFGTQGPFNGGDPSVNGGIFNQALSGGNTPQQQGFGIADVGPLGPYQPAPGLTTAQPGSYNANFDLSGPGAAESYWQSVAGKSGGAPAAANLDPFYERARERTAGDINKQLAARGQFGSSVGGGMLGDALSNLSAEQANREADYGLRRDQNELGWMGGMGQLAGQAQQAQQGRIGDLFGYNTALGDRMSGMYGNQMNQMLGDDQNAMQAAMLAEMGLAQQAVDAGNATPQKILDETEQATGIMGNIMTAGIL